MKSPYFYGLAILFMTMSMRSGGLLIPLDDDYPGEGHERH